MTNQTFTMETTLLGSFNHRKGLPTDNDFKTKCRAQQLIDRSGLKRTTNISTASGDST